MKSGTDDNCFERAVALEDDWLNGRIPISACSLELLAAQVIVIRAGTTPSMAAKLGNSMVEVWADVQPPLRAGGLRDIDHNALNATSRMQSHESTRFAEWIVRQTMDATEPLNPAVTEFGRVVFLSVAMLAAAVLGAAGLAVTEMDRDKELSLHTSWTILLLTAHMHRATTGTLVDFVKHERHRITAEKKSAVGKRLVKYASVQAKAVMLARAGKFVSVRRAAEAVLPKIRVEALAAGWFRTRSSKDSNMKTLYGYLLKIPGVVYKKEKALPKSGGG